METHELNQSKNSDIKSLTANQLHNKGAAETSTAKLETNKALSFVEQMLNVDIVIYNGPINEDGYGQFVQATKNILPSRKLMLILVTYGGSADSAYRIARYAQNFFEDFILFVPNACKSAGTLIALGASKIYMSPFGELGPLDVQVFKSDEIFERRSGLTSKSAVWSLTEEAFRTFEEILLNLKMRSAGTVTFKAASLVAASITNGLLAPIAAQLDPLALGEDYQNLHIAHEYGEKLVQKFGTINSDAVRSLVELYPSHGFVIDLFEAMELFGNVEMASQELIQLQACLPSLSNKPSVREVSVQRLRDTIEEEKTNDQQDSRSAKDADKIGGSSLARQDQRHERGDRSADKKERERPNGSGDTLPDGKTA